MNESSEGFTALYNFLEKLNINKNQENFGLVIHHLHAIAPLLIKLDSKREFFTTECEKQLKELSGNITGPFKPVNRGGLGNELYRLFVHIAENEMTEEVGYLCALFVYSQLNTLLITGHTASPNVKTNRSRLRVFIEKVSKKAILLNEYSESENSIVDAEILLADVIANDKIEEHKKTAILLGNIYKAIRGNNDFSVMNKKRVGPAEPKLSVKRYNIRRQLTCPVGVN